MVKRKLILTFAYLAFLVLAFLYIRSVLKTEDLVPRDTTKPKVEKTWDVSVYLRVYAGDRVENYFLKIKNNNTVLAFLEDLRDDYGLIYEKVDYSHGVEIESVFNVIASSGYRWALFYNNIDITPLISSQRVADGALYEIKLVEK